MIVELEGDDVFLVSEEARLAYAAKEEEKRKLVDQLRGLLKRAPELGFVPQDLQDSLWADIHKLYKV